jgi:ArsR family transcriptional regulator
LTTSVPGQAEAERLTAVFKALGDPARVRLVALIAASPGQEACVCNLVEAVGLAQSTVSHHMRRLADAGLVQREQRGKWAYYRLAPGVLRQVAATLAPEP